MYKVMIVDDERLIVNGLENIIDWNGLELGIVHKAFDGCEALKKFKETNVDIVITDITMPNMNGLRLIEEIKSISPNAKFIILSGYNDFNYAKKAISIGIENYILKPINEEELEDTLKVTVEKIKREKKLPVFEKKDIETIKDNIYNRWVTNRISQYELEERDFILELNLNYNNYCVALMKLKNNKGTGDVGVIDKIKERYRCENIIFFRDMEDNIISIAGWNDDNWSEENFQSVLRDIVDYISKELNQDVFITVGDIQKLCSNAYLSYEKAKELQHYLLISGYNKMINESTILQKTKKYKHVSKIDLEEFSKVLMKKDRNSVETYITDTFMHISDNEIATPALIQDIAANMIFIIRRTMQELNIKQEEDYVNISEMIFSICKKETLDEVRECIKSESFKILDTFDANSQKYSPVIQQILDYIKHNFAEDVSLKVLADKYNINTSYLGQLFTKEVGVNFSDYLNKVKNEKAKHLLLNTNMRINEIAKSIGYLDTSYFYRKFKKYYGVCPNDLRSSKNYQSS